MKRNDGIHPVTGQHHVPLLKFGQKYSSESDNLEETKNVVLSTPFISTPPIPTVYYNNPISKELLLVKMNHPAIVTHKFTTNRCVHVRIISIVLYSDRCYVFRICTVSVDVIVQNCCDCSVEVKLDSTYQTPNKYVYQYGTDYFLYFLIY